MANIPIFGSSRGLGAALIWGVPVRGDKVWLVSRGRPDLDDRDGVQRVWIEADLSAHGAGPAVARLWEIRSSSPSTLAKAGAGISCQLSPSSVERCSLTPKWPSACAA